MQMRHFHPENLRYNIPFPPSLPLSLAPYIILCLWTYNDGVGELVQTLEVAKNTEHAAGTSRDSV